MCEHEYTVITWRISDKSKNASQLMCVKCCNILDSDDILRLYDEKHKDKEAKKVK